MELTAEDRWAIGETISLHGHLFDNGELDRLDELFTADVVYDLTDVGMEPLHGIDEIRRAALNSGPATPSPTTSRTSRSQTSSPSASEPGARRS